MASNRLVLALTFLNTTYLNGIPDALASAAEARRWLAGEGFAGVDEGLEEHLPALQAIAGPPPFSEDDVARARRVREALLAWIDGRTLEQRAIEGLAFGVDATGGDPALRPSGAGITALAAHTYLVLTELRIAGKSDRLRRCEADDCRWVFYDRSRNRSRVWCDMSGCGSKAKARAYRARRSALESG